MARPLVAVALELDFPSRRPKTKPRTIRVPAAGVIARDSTDLFQVDDDLVRSILRYVEANLDKPLAPASLAERFSVSRRTMQPAGHHAATRNQSRAPS